MGNNIKIVIGANYGDEGKGLVSYFFTQNSPHPCNILYNGGAQRGHTAGDYVFHTLGAGTFAKEPQNVPTIYMSSFFVDPVAIGNENYNLSNSKSKMIQLPFLHENNRVVLPYDIIINKAIERQRKKTNTQHGSCGMGIWESFLRNQKIPILVKDFENLNQLYYKIKNTIPYYENRVESLELLDKSIIKLIRNFSLESFFTAVVDTYSKDIVVGKNRENLLLNNYNIDSFIFEAGQGLLLDENNLDNYPNLTPSSTGSNYLYNLINNIPTDISIEVCYVTRSYMTRHGAGFLPHEKNKVELKKEIFDNTNQPNEFQGELRYGLIDTKKLIDRINKDFSKYKRKVTKSIAVTHLNYSDGKIFGVKDNKIKMEDIEIFKKDFDNIYGSYKKDSLQLLWRK